MNIQSISSHHPVYGIRMSMDHFPPPPSPLPFQRICVVGTTGSGKSMLASELSRRLQLPYIELDALYWRPGWTHCTNDELRQQIALLIQADAWVVDGNYSYIRDLTFTRAEAVVWLDYPLSLILWRLLKRTVKRTITRELLWGTNTERLLSQFFSADSLFLWALKTYSRRKRTYTALIASGQYGNITFYHLRSPGQTKAWLKTVTPLPVSSGTS